MPRKGERMLTRIRIEATGETAHDVERDLRADADSIKQALGIQTTEPPHQVIEGTPGEGFNGRLSFVVGNRATVRVTPGVGVRANG